MTKQEQRNRIRTLRKSLKPEDAAGKSREICERLMSLPEVANAKNIFSYLAMSGEVDLSTVHDFLISRGAEIAFPAVFGDGIMQALIPGDDTFHTGAFGIREPVRDRSRQAPPEGFDLVLAPCVGFDSGCRRLGHGSGYYDRYLPGCRNAVLICPAFEFQRFDRIAAGDSDIPVDIVVTETGIYRNSEGH